jgi:predicted alpha/beta-hydrolase family hydrolase
MKAVESFANQAPGQPAVRGFLHRPDGDATAALVLTHGAGSNCRAPLLVAMAEAFAAGGIAVLRCDLPFRQSRPHGPPFGNGANDRAGLRRAVELLREIVPAPTFLGGHSYGGRQASMLAAEDPTLASGLLLLSYPLHPPKKPEQLRTAHFPNLQTPALFVHGCRDPFGSLDEIQSARGLIPATTELLHVEGAGHDLGRGGYDALASKVLDHFLKLVNQP